MVGGVQHCSTEDASNSSDPRYVGMSWYIRLIPMIKGSIASGKGGWNISRSSRKTMTLIFQPGYSSNFGPNF